MLLLPASQDFDRYWKRKCVSTLQNINCPVAGGILWLQWSAVTWKRQPRVCLVQVVRTEFLWTGPGCMGQTKPLYADAWRCISTRLWAGLGDGQWCRARVSCRALAGVAARRDQHGHGRPGPGARVRPLRESGEGLYLWVPCGPAQACLAGSSRVPLVSLLVAGTTPWGAAPRKVLQKAVGKTAVRLLLSLSVVFSWGFWFHNTCGRNRWREEVNRLAPSIYLQGELSCYFQVTMATHSSTLAWQIPWTEEPGRLQSMGLLRVEYDWVSSLSLSCIGEENGNPLQCSCLEDTRDGGAWWAAISGVAQSQTRLKRLSSSSSSSKGYLLCIEWNFRSFGQDAWFPPILKNFKNFEIIMDL